MSGAAKRTVARQWRVVLENPEIIASQKTMQQMRTAIQGAREIVGAQNVRFAMGPFEGFSGSASLPVRRLGRLRGTGRCAKR